MGAVKRIAVLDTEVEAKVLESILVARDIPHVLRTYHDSVCDGLFQGPRGWGHIEAPEEHEVEILGILHDMRTGKLGEGETVGDVLD